MNKKYQLLFLFVVLFLIFIFFDFREINDSFLGNTNIFEKPTISVLNFGDVMFDRGVRNIMENRGRDPFEYIKKDLDVIKRFNVVIANLEGPITEINRSLCQQKDYNFQFSSNTPEILKSAGINMVSLANNHTNDCYAGGLISTKNYLQKAGIDYIGDQDLEKSLVVKIINNKKVAFVGMDETVQSIPITSFYPLIKRLKTENGSTGSPQADYIVVDIHWGTEYELTQSAAQTVIAHNLIDNGADVIFGSHPHVIEPVEIYKNKAIFYSLGNFIFDQNFGDTTLGLGAGVEFGGNKATFTIFPYRMKLFAPDFLKGEEKEMFCDKYLSSLNHTGCIFEL